MAKLNPSEQELIRNEIGSEGVKTSSFTDLSEAEKINVTGNYGAGQGHVSRVIEDIRILGPAYATPGD